MRRVFGFFIYQPEKTCPRCGSMHVHRTKRGRILEYWVLMFMDVRPYRCGKCRLRFYGPKKVSDVNDRYEEEFASAEEAAPSSRGDAQPSHPSRR
jgi:ribosomal protein S27AE